MTQRKPRMKQYLANKSGVIIPMSPSLVTCARAELRAGLEERKRRTVWSNTNHSSQHALGSIVLVVTAFDVWLNEVAMQVDTPGRSHAKQIAAKAKGTVAKYTDLMEKVAGVKVQDLRELRTVIDLRDEIVHFYPRVMDEKGNVPDWFRALHSKGLLLGGTAEHAFAFPMNLNSYHLAYWVWEQIERAVVGLSNAMKALGPEYENVGWMANNFGSFRQLCPPARLLDYDAEHGLGTGDAGIGQSEELSHP